MRSPVGDDAQPETSGVTPEPDDLGPRDPDPMPSPASSPAGGGDDRAVSGTCYPTCTSATADSDGDGWGFQNGATCLVEGGDPFREGDPCQANSPLGPSGNDPEPAAMPTARKFVGNITTQNEIRPDFLDYWDQITPENEGKWASVESNRGQMNWARLDTIVDFARENSIPFKQHTFVWGDQSPGWLDGLTQDEQRAETEEWMRLFCERYPDTQLIDVVNEPDHKTPSFIDAYGGAGETGHDWVIWAFEAARRYCPDAELILNDYNVLRWDTDNFISIARKVRDAGVLDAIACQGHGLEDIALDELRTNLDRIADIGVKVYISEYDIDLADDGEQLRVMEEQFPVLYEHPAVAGITLWGYVHGATWVPDSGLIRNGQPRPALTWLMDYLGR